MPLIAPMLMSVLLTVQAGQEPAQPLAMAVAAPWTDDRPITHFFQNLGRDFSHVPSDESAALLIAFGSFTAVAHEQDARMAGWVSSRGDSRYTVVGDVLGRRPLHVGAAVSLWIIGKATDNARIAHVGSDIIRSQAVSGLLTVGIKVATSRERPDGESRSFPSGHTSTAFATATVLQRHFGWKVGTVAYALAGSVAWARVRDDRHWLSDVVMGSAIGIVSARAVTGSHARWLITPVKTTGGVAVFVTRRPSVAVR